MKSIWARPDLTEPLRTLEAFGVVEAVEVAHTADAVERILGLLASLLVARTHREFDAELVEAVLLDLADTGDVVVADLVSTLLHLVSSHTLPAWLECSDYTDPFGEAATDVLDVTVLTLFAEAFASI